MNENNFNTGLIDSLRRILEPLEVGFTNENILRSFLKDYGWDVTVNASEMSDLRNALGISPLMRQIEDVFEQLESADDNNTVHLIREIITLNLTVFTTIKNLSGQPGLPPPFNQNGFWQEFIPDVINDLTLDVIEEELPVLFAVMTIVGLFEENTVTPPEAGRITYQKRIAHWDRLGGFITDPLNAIQDTYGWGEAIDGFDFKKFIRNIDILFTQSGFTPNLDVPDQPLLDAYFANSNPVKPDVRQLNIPFVLEIAAGFSSFAEVGISLLPITIKGDLDSAPVGFLIAPLIQGSISSPNPGNLDGVELKVSTGFEDGSLGRVEVRPDAIDIVGPDNPSIDVSISLTGKPESPYILIGTKKSHRIELEGFLVSLGIKGRFDDPEVVLKAGTGEGSNGSRLRFIFQAGEGDGFIKDIIGEEPQSIDLSGYISVSSKHGVGINGNVGFQLQFPLHISLGPIDIESLQLGTAATDAGGADIPIGLNVRSNLGPLTVVVENIGAKMTLTPTTDKSSSGILGNLDVDWAFKPPTGLGLTIDGGGFKGGGFLGFDPAKERYVGFLELELKETVELKAIGLLTTRLPGGEPGFSLLIIITAEFNPIQLGFGFTLNGVGGLLGLNRTMRIERLRTGIRDNTLTSILFPPDPVANANRIISDLRQVFPPQPDRFVFGPMGKIGWGTPTLITIDVGLALEIPDPVTLAILGVLKALLPDEEKKLLKLQVNFLGVIEFEKQQLSFDATIYDSKLLSFPLSGDMALRLSWGNNPNFLLTVGGFHPAYDPPPLALPPLRPLTLQLLQGKNPRLTLETYFAVTSNTVQFGAKLELYAGAGPFNVHGLLAFDALFQFSPFYFIAAISAMLALRRGSNSIASIKLALTLEGTTPWKVKGTATLKLCWFIKVKVRFNKTFGKSRDTRLDDVEVLPLLTAALRQARNWEARPPARRHLLVSLKEIDTTGDIIVAHPFGVLTVSQKVVPLNVRIDTFGHQQPRDGHEFRITDVTVEGRPQDQVLDAAQEYFAPAQFFEKSDAEKLSSKSFERYDSGIRLTKTEELESDHVVRREVEYELSYIDSQRSLFQPPTLIAPDLVAFNTWASRGAIAQSPLSHVRTGKSALAPDAVRVAQEDYAVVTVSDLTPAAADPVRGSEAEALAYMQELIAQEPALGGQLQVVPTFELN